MINHLIVKAIITIPTPMGDCTIRYDPVDLDDFEINVEPLGFRHYKNVNVKTLKTYRDSINSNYKDTKIYNRLLCSFVSAINKVLGANVIQLVIDKEDHDRKMEQCLEANFRLHENNNTVTFNIDKTTIVLHSMLMEFSHRKNHYNKTDTVAKQIGIRFDEIYCEDWLRHPFDRFTKPFDNFEKADDNSIIYNNTLSIYHKKLIIQKVDGKINLIDNSESDPYNFLQRMSSFYGGESTAFGLADVLHFIAYLERK